MNLTSIENSTCELDGLRGKICLLIIQSICERMNKSLMSLL